MDKYLKERRALGYKLVCEGRYLKNFAKFADEQNAPFLNNDLFLSWKDQYGNASSPTWKRRLSVYRIFTIWHSAIDDKTEIPPSDLIPGRHHQRQKPYIYTDLEIRKIVNAAGQLNSRLGLRSLTYSTVFHLLAVTGMRINECISLSIHDIDLDKNVIKVWSDKNKSERLVPITKKVSGTLKRYRKQTIRLTNRTQDTFFVVEGGRHISEHTTRYAFAQIGQTIGLRKREKFHRLGRGPRIHDLRHTFAVNTLIDAYKNGGNIDDCIYRLSIFLGHHSIKGTYWYLEAVPQLMRLGCKTTPIISNE